MIGIRTLACGVAAWIVLTNTATAAPLSWFDSQATLTAWYANQLNSAGNNIYAPAASSTISNLPIDWYNRSTPTPAPAPIVPAPVAAPIALAPAPAPVAPTYTPTPVAAVTPAAPASAATLNVYEGSIYGKSNMQADAFVNMGEGPYPGAYELTSGEPSAWYRSPAAISVFGGSPDSSQQASFTQDVFHKVERTFELSGVDVNLTADPNTPASHTMSVVSSSQFGGNLDAIGITRVGQDGFTFIDKFNYAKNPDELSWAVAHNVAHELMHAFGVAHHPDESGEYIDSAVANWALLTNPDARFSPSAVAVMGTLSSNGISSQTLGEEIANSGVLSAQCICTVCYAAQGLSFDGDPALAAPVPEPATIAVWAMASIVGGLVIRHRNGRRS